MKTPVDPVKQVRSFFSDFFGLSAKSLSCSSGSMLAAVSGGADSVFMLAALYQVARDYGVTVSAATVNHRMRSEVESAGDAQFVQELCASFNPPIPCFRIDLKPGAVLSLAKERRKGEEDAARVLRYKEIFLVAEKEGIPWVCTGHTKNDQLETLLMRSIQGAGTAGMRGIAAQRGQLLRPLLDVERIDLERWLLDHGYSWREDHTNQEERYLRNRIRSQIVPALDSAYPGWKTGFLAGALKASTDESFIESFPLPLWQSNNGYNTGSLKCEASEYFSLHPALRLRFLQRGLLDLKISDRIPHALLDQMISPVNHEKNGVLVSGAGLVFSRSGSNLFFETDIVQNSNTGYLVYIVSCGVYELPFGSLSVTVNGEAVFLDGHLGPFAFPLIVRSRLGGDTIQTAAGRKKTLKKLLNDWSVRERDRAVLPIIECAGRICAVYGTPLGYPHWYVRR
ncbi:MAG TPA: tRNA lysidine(34) synthetase TilS [Treponema sp.]|nr:tRNA lysidine(34) synthetase TilS [Treponema sp.]